MVQRVSVPAFAQIDRSITPDSRIARVGVEAENGEGLVESANVSFSKIAIGITESPGIGNAVSGEEVDIRHGMRRCFLAIG